MFLSAFIGILSFIVAIITSMLEFNSTGHKPVEIATQLPIILCLSIMALAFGLSITRVFAKLSIKTIGNGVIKNVVLFFVIITTYYAVTEFWNEFVWIVRALGVLAISVILQNSMGSMTSDHMYYYLNDIGNFFLQYLSYHAHRLAGNAVEPEAILLAVLCT